MKSMRVLGKQLLDEGKKDPPQNAKPVRQGQVLPTENEAWGFFGTMYTALKGDGDEADVHVVTGIWTAAFAAFMDVYPGIDSKVVREFLDSKGGRRFADMVVSDLSKQTDPWFAWASEPKRIRRVVNAILKDDQCKWVAKDLSVFAGTEIGIAHGGTGAIGVILGRATKAFSEVQSQEARKNWKERADAMKDLMTAADALASATRAWFANNK